MKTPEFKQLLQMVAGGWNEGNDLSYDDFLSTNKKFEYTVENVE